MRIFFTYGHLRGSRKSHLRDHSNIDSISKKSDFRKDKSGNNPDQCETCYRKNLLIIGTSHKVNLIQIFGRGVEVYIDNQLP